MSNVDSSKKILLTAQAKVNEISQDGRKEGKEEGGERTEEAEKRVFLFSFSFSILSHLLSPSYFRFRADDFWESFVTQTQNERDAEIRIFPRLSLSGKNEYPFPNEIGHR